MTHVRLATVPGEGTKDNACSAVSVFGTILETGACGKARATRSAEAFRGHLQ